MNKPLILASAIATLLVAQKAHSADLFWDGGSNSWNTPGNWSTTLNATTPDPSSVPGPGDIAIFDGMSVTAAQIITLDAPQSVLGIATNSNNKHVTSLRGGGTSQVLTIGAQGIDHRFGGLDIGSTLAGQEVEISLLGSQTWNSASSNTTQARAIFVFNGISLGTSGNHTLELTGTTTGGEIRGVISDGTSGGVLGITKTNATGRWTIFGQNTYTGPTTITGGTLAVSSIANAGVASGIGAASNAASNLVFDGGTLLYTGGSTSTDRGFTITAGKTAGLNIAGADTILTFSAGSAATDGGLNKQGQGALDFSAAHTYSGLTKITQGRLLLTGAGSVANSEISIGVFNTSTAMTTVPDSGILTISTAGGAVTRGGAITVEGGVLSNTTGVRTLLLNGTALANSHDSFGAVTINNGAFWGHVIPAASTNARLTFASLTRAAGTQLHFGDTTSQIGTASIASATAGTANVEFTTAPTSQLVGGPLGTPTAAVLPFATVNGVIATYDPANGLRALNPATEMTELSSALAGQNAKVTTAGTSTLSSDVTVNSLWGNQGTAALSGRTLGITSGAIAASGSYTIGATRDDGAVNFGATEGNVMVAEGAVLKINSVIAGSGGLTVGLASSITSDATVVLNGTNTFTGFTTILANNSNLKLTIANGLALQGSTLNYVGNGGSVQFGADDAVNGLLVDVTSATVGGLRGSQTLSLTNSGPAGGGVALTVGSTVSGEDSTYSGVFTGPGSVIKDGPGTLTLQGGAHNSHTGGTFVQQGVLKLAKVSGGTSFNAIPGDLTITSGGKLTFANDNQIADTAHVVMSGADSVFNGTAANVGARALVERFESLTVTGGAFTTGATTTGMTITGMASFTGGSGQTIFLANSGSRFTVGGLSLTGMTETAGSNVATPNSFTIYGNSGTFRSTLTVGAGGLALNGSVLNLRRGALGSRLVLDGNVSTSGSFPSSISIDTNGGANGQVSIDLSSTAGDFNRTFDIAGGGADFFTEIPIVNGAATSGAITKAGPGTMTLTAASTYTGGTTINEGTLLANNIAGSATGTGSVAVGINGTLGGTGTISGAVTVANGGTLMGGTGLTPTEDLGISGNLSLADDSVIKLSLGPAGTHSSLLRLGGTWTFAADQAFTFVELGGQTGFYDDIISGLAGAPNMSQWTITNSGFIGSFTFDGSNVDLTLTAVPEPATATALLAGLGFLGGFRRFGRRRA